MAININPFYKGQAQARRAMAGPKSKATEARLKALKEATRTPGVRVVPVYEKDRATLMHVPSRRRFRSEGSVEWPNDRFTQRRIAEGVIRVVAPDEEQPTHQSGHRRTAPRASE